MLWVASSAWQDSQGEIFTGFKAQQLKILDRTAVKSAGAHRSVMTYDPRYRVSDN